MIEYFTQPQNQFRVCQQVDHITRITGIISFAVLLHQLFKRNTGRITAPDKIGRRIHRVCDGNQIGQNIQTRIADKILRQIRVPTRTIVKPVVHQCRLGIHFSRRVSKQHLITTCRMVADNIKFRIKQTAVVHRNRLQAHQLAQIMEQPGIADNPVDLRFTAPNLCRVLCSQQTGKPFRMPVRKRHRECRCNLRNHLRMNIGRSMTLHHQPDCQIFKRNIIQIGQTDQYITD